tara:strand:+ start:5464 stop:6459 length:996 start_codon:yes stop_codon:yes gene_type:complete
MLKFKSFSNLVDKEIEELSENEALRKKAAKSGISYGTLKKVFNRGMAAWKSGHRPGTTPQQWGHARVNSYITKGKGTYYGADSDLSGKGKKKDKKEGYVSYAQQKAAHASMAEKGKKKKNNESVDEAKHDPKHIKQAIGIASDPRYAKGNMTGAVKAMNKISKDIDKHPQVAAVLKRQNEAKVQEISKGLAMRYIGKASRDVYHKGQQQGTADAISRLGGPTKDYKKSPERKAAKRVAGIDRATKITSMGPLSYPIGKSSKKNEAMSDAEKAAHQKAINTYMAKGGKVTKLKPGYAQGYHGKADPGAGIKGMIDKGDTKQFGTKKKIGSMK